MEVAIAKAWTSDSIERAFWRAHQVHAGVGYTIDDGAMPLFSRRAKSHQLYLGDSAHHMNKVAGEIDKWPAPEMPKGKPLGLWDIPEEEQRPAWQPWRERWEAINRRREERRKVR
jgi:hypothetical protein